MFCAPIRLAEGQKIDDMIKLSVIIATYNRADNLLRTLRSLLCQELDRRLWEVVVVNNNCSDNTSEICERFAEENPTLNFKMEIEHAQGLSHARNCGIAKSCGEYIVIVDDDQEFVVGFLSAYYDFFEANSEAVVAGGSVVPLYEFETPSWLTPYTERPIAGTLDLGDKITTFKGSSYPAGGNMALRRSVFDSYGLFNTSLGRTGTSLMGGEEKDLFQRVRSEGVAMYYLPKAVMYHIIPRSRMSREYVYKVALMIGRSERTRTLGISKGAYIRRLAEEVVKWAGTSILLGLYTLRGRPLAGWTLVRMRWNITKGLLAGGL